MTRKKAHALIAGIFLVITVIGCIVTAVVFPPAIPAIAVVGGAVVTWFIAKSLDKVADHMNEDTAPHDPAKTTIGDELHQRTYTIHRHYSETDQTGHHVIEDIQETVVEEDPPPRPKKPGLER